MTSSSLVLSEEEILELLEESLSENKRMILMMTVIDTIRVKTTMKTLKMCIFLVIQQKIRGECGPAVTRTLQIFRFTIKSVVVSQNLATFHRC